MQPLMNMITFTARDRARIVKIHSEIADALQARMGDAAAAALTMLEQETQNLARSVFEARKEAAT